MPLTRGPLEEPGFEHWLSLTPKLAFLPLCHRELIQYVPIPEDFRPSADGPAVGGV